jgi:hypothetical protein
MRWPPWAASRKTEGLIQRLQLPFDNFASRFHLHPPSDNQAQPHVEDDERHLHRAALSEARSVATVHHRELATRFVDVRIEGGWETRG